MKRILVTGAAGMTGSEVCEQATAAGWMVQPLSRTDADITDARTFADLTRKFRPDVVVNAAAYTAVDRAEADADLAMAVNCEGARNVARAAASAGAPIIHISTDYVFNGEGRSPYKPDARTDPVSVYGRTKLAGEAAVQEENPNHVIVRTSWVFSHRGSNFVRTMLRLGAERDELRVVEDQVGRPTSAADLASALLIVARAIAENPALAGVYHFANAGETSWFGFAQGIFEHARALGERHTPRIVPIPTSEFPNPARRPSYSVLDTASFSERFGVEPRSWQSAVRDTVALSLRNILARARA
jgi:dTDP-4-dehydrorhamnose reductase